MDSSWRISTELRRSIDICTWRVTEFIIVSQLEKHWPHVEQCGTTPYLARAQRSHNCPVTPGLHVHCPVCGSHSELIAPSLEHWHGWHALGSPYVPGGHWSHRRPPRFGLQRHCPVNLLHTDDSLPSGLHLQSEQ